MEARRPEHERAEVELAALVSGEMPVVLLQDPGIGPDDPMSEAGRKILYYHFQRMVHNEPGTRLGEDVEALHDMRVATRRMRAAFRVFGDYFRPEVVAPHLKGLGRTGRALGRVRDLDVFRERVWRYLASLPVAQQDSLNGLLVTVEAKREASRRRMIDYLDSDRYTRFREGYREFVTTAGMGSRALVLTGGEPRPYRVRHVAPMTIYSRLAAVRAYDEWVREVDTPLARFHRLRIACKRLRYTLEFFSEVLGPDANAAIKAVVVMQDHLGALQDAVVASNILREFLRRGTWGREDDLPQPDLSAKMEAPGVEAYLTAKQAEIRHLVDTFPEVWSNLRGIEFSRMIAEAVVVL